MRCKVEVVVIAGLWLTGLCKPLPAAETLPALSLYAAAPEAAPHAVEHDPAVQFHKGMYDVELTGSYVKPITYTHNHYGVGTVGVGYYLLDNFAVTAALAGYYVDQPDDAATAVGLDLTARLHLLTLDRFSLYADIGAGVFYGDRPVPDGGTYFDFTPRAGVGGMFRLGEHVYLLGGARYFHLSNAGIRGRERNPGFDGLQAYGGMMFTF